MIAGIKYEEITNEGLKVITRDGETKTFEADTIIPAVPLTPNDGLLKELEKKVVRTERLFGKDRLIKGFKIVTVDGKEIP